MVKKVVISHFNNIAAIFHNNKIQELIIVNNAYQVNDIYIGIVHKIFSSINAAFVKLNTNSKSGFIHINDIKHLKKNRYATRITDILSINQIILVQIIKEPTRNKGPRLTTNINLSGKYIVLMPFCNTICVSDKIYDQNERIYLHSLGILLKPAKMGILIRSSAEGVSEEAIIEDLRYLKKQWNFIEKAAISAKLPSLLYKEEDLIKKIIYNIYETNIKKIIIDSDNGLKQIKHHLQKCQCIKSNNKIQLQLYSQPECLLERFNIRQTILAALRPKVNLSLGGHIIIENNEAMTVIDVNSGSFNKSDNSQETILRTNFYAAIEIAHQLKIRNLNGVIVVDFIDMESFKDQLRLIEHFSQLLELDEAKPQIVQLSELGLVELTRRRRGQSLQEIFTTKSHNYLNFDTNTMFKYSDYSQKNKWQNIVLIYKNIKSLFFTKKFNKSLTLYNKQFRKRQRNIHYNKTYLYVDKVHTIKLIETRKNYIIPLKLYSSFIQK